MRRLAQASFLNSLALALLFSRSPVVLAQAPASFRRGDANADSRVDLSDSIFTLRYLFVGGTSPPCLDAGDSNDDGLVDISDAVHILIHLFLGGADLPAPGLLCGADPTQDALDCGSYEPCNAHQGQSEFATPLAGAPGAGVPGREDQAGGPAPPAGPPAPPSPPAQGRTVEESDIYKLAGTNLFVLNRYRGLQILDLSDLDHPHLLGRAPIFGYPREMYVRGSTAYVIVRNGSTLAFHRYPFRFWWDCLACPAGARAIDGGQSPEDTIYLVDLKDPDSPKLASTVTLPSVDWAWGLRVSPPRSPQGDGVSGTTLYLSIYRAFIEDNLWMARYYLRRIEVADPASPVELPEVNIPGMFVDASPVGGYIYTLETYWDQSAQKSRSLFHVLAIDGEKAFLQSSVELEGYVSGIQVKESAAFATTEWWETRAVEGGGSLWITHADLLAIDLADPRAVRVSGKAAIPFDYAYLQKVEGGRAFLGSGAGIFTYSVSDIANLGFEEFFRTQGWSQDIVVRGNLAFVPSGYYGVQVLHLGSSPGG